MAMRDPIANALCPECQREAQTLSGGNVGEIFVTVPHVPPEFSGTHRICASCLELCHENSRHAERCELGIANMALQSAGWATALSEFLRRDLRARRPKWIPLAATLLSAVVDPFSGAGDAILVPIPVSAQVHDQDGLLAAVALVGAHKGIPVLRAVARNKRRSTRLSGKQVRRRIVEEEYELDSEVVNSIQGRQVILVDDTVTTGTTMAGIATLLRSAGAGAIVPVSIDRTVSPRLQQRLIERARGRCSHMSAPAGK